MKSLENQIECLIPSIKKSQKNGVSGLPTGYDELDKITTGWHKGELIVISAPHKMGKTYLALSILINSFQKGRLGAVWFSTNHAVIQLIKMFLCNNFNIEGYKFLSGGLNYEELHNMLNDFKFADINFDDSPYLTINDLDVKIASQKQKWPIELIIIDNVNELNYQKNCYLDLTDKFYQLKTLARKYDIPIICLFNDEIPENHFVDYNTSLEVLAKNKIADKSIDILIQLFRPEYYKITEFEEAKTEFEVGKNCLGFADLIVSGRSVKNGIARLKYEPLFFKLSDTSVDINKCE